MFTIEADQGETGSQSPLDSDSARPGTLTVSTARDETVPQGVSAPAVRIQIADTGTGIPERYLEKLFEPYFTTKPDGTGLGMSITRRIIEDHKGTISVASREGSGTTVTVWIPV